MELTLAWPGHSNSQEGVWQLWLCTVEQILHRFIFFVNKQRHSLTRTLTLAHIQNKPSKFSITLKNLFIFERAKEIKRNETAKISVLDVFPHEKWGSSLHIKTHPAGSLQGLTAHTKNISINLERGMFKDWKSLDFKWHKETLEEKRSLFTT